MFGFIIKFELICNDYLIKYEYISRGINGGRGMEQELKWIKAILRRGSREAADLLVHAYYDDIYAFTYRQVGNREDALDLTQEIFIAALRSLPSYDQRKASFRTWLYRIATHKVIDARRRTKPITIPIDEEDITEDDFASNALDKDLLERIEEYVRALDPLLQEVFRLRIYADYSFPEIAQATGQAEEKVKARYYRLIKRLRKEFEYYA